MVFWAWPRPSLLPPPQSGPEDRGHLPSVLGAALLPAPLRLRHAGRKVGPDGGGKPEAQVPRGGGERAAAAGAHGRQHGQVPGAGCAAVRGDPLTPPSSSSFSFSTSPVPTTAVSVQCGCS